MQRAETVERPKLTPSARMVLRVLAKTGGATFDDLLIHVRPMSEQGLLWSVLMLQREGLVYLSDHDGQARLTDAGRAAA